MTMGRIRKRPTAVDKIELFLITVQGDASGCSLGSVDIKAKVPF